MATINSDTNLTVAAALDYIESSRWLGPEVAIPSRKGTTMAVVESKAADVFAFAMVVIEVYTGRVPFSGEPAATVPSLVLKGERPEMPQDAEQVGLTDDIWEFLKRCWHQNPKKRPATKEVVRKWQKFC